MAKDEIRTDIDQTFYTAEQAGLKLAIKGRLIALLLVGLYLVPTRGAERASDIVVALSALAALGIFHFLVIGSAWDRRWVKYAFLSIDLVLLSAAVAYLPPEPKVDVPQIFMFRFDVFYYYYIVLGVAAFSFSPGLVLWAGAFGAGGWLAAFAWVRSGMAAPLEWSDALEDRTTEQFLGVFLNENFVATGSRVHETVIYLVVAVLIAAVVHRARQTVRRQLEAERETATVSEIFGRFVPEAVARSMIEDRGVLAPIERPATVVFIDVADFTNLTESRGPRATVDVLNAYFDAATEIISAHHGVVTQFQGDAILAVFNVPIEDPHHARHAFDAARAMLRLVATRTFAESRIRIRIGIHTGPLVAGNVGGGGRATYTVHGDTVNLAARLEALNKEHGTVLLVSAATAHELGEVDLVEVGHIAIRGLSAPVEVFTLRDADG